MGTTSLAVTMPSAEIVGNAVARRLGRTGDACEVNGDMSEQMHTFVFLAVLHGDQLPSCRNGRPPLSNRAPLVAGDRARGHRLARRYPERLDQMALREQDWRLAEALAVHKRYGAAAPMHVAGRIGELALAADHAGVKRWQQIAAELERLMGSITQ